MSARSDGVSANRRTDNSYISPMFHFNQELRGGTPALDLIGDNGRKTPSLVKAVDQNRVDITKIAWRLDLMMHLCRVGDTLNLALQHKSTGPTFYVWIAMRIDDERILPFRHASSCAPCMTWPANGDVAAPLLTNPTKSECPLARLQAIAFCRHLRSSVTFRTFLMVDSGILTFLLSLTAQDAVAIETTTSRATSCSVTMMPNPNHVTQLSISALDPGNRQSPLLRESGHVPRKNPVQEWVCSMIRVPYPRMARRKSL